VNRPPYRRSDDTAAWCGGQGSVTEGSGLRTSDRASRAESRTTRTMTVGNSGIGISAFRRSQLAARIISRWADGRGHSSSC
jgi:hypothetical protein